ncbi:MAG: hypothetical protein GY856_48070 [bacterium]|nr:hypothetical protein [bacterium]
MSNDETPSELQSIEPTPLGWRALRALAPVVAVAAVFQAAGSFYERFDLKQLGLAHGPDWQKVGSALEVVTKDFLNRHSLHLSAAALALCWLVTVGICTYVILRSRQQRRLRLAVLAIPVLATAWVLLQAKQGTTFILVSLPRELLKAFFRYTGVEDLTTVENFLTALVLSALAFIIAGAVAILLAEDAQGTERLRERYQRLQIVLYTGAAMLVVGVLHVNSILQWPAVFLSEADAKILKMLADGYSADTGLYWTMILLAVYLPSTLVLRAEAWILARRTLSRSTAKEHKEWLLKEKLSPSLLGQLSHLVAILGPFLAGGPLATLLTLAGA